jgi:hypothetical protein
VVPGQDYCTWTGEDMTQIFAEIHSQLVDGAQILIQMTSEGTDLF